MCSQEASGYYNYEANNQMLSTGGLIQVSVYHKAITMKCKDFEMYPVHSMLLKSSTQLPQELIYKVHTF